MLGILVISSLSLSLCVIFITGTSVDSTCHELSEYVRLYGSVKHILSCTVAPGGRADERTKVFQEVHADLKATLCKKRIF